VVKSSLSQSELSTVIKLWADQAITHTTMMFSLSFSIGFLVIPNSEFHFWLLCVHMFIYLYKIILY